MKAIKQLLVNPTREQMLMYAILGTVLFIVSPGIITGVFGVWFWVDYIWYPKDEQRQKEPVG